MARKKVIALAAGFTFLLAAGVTSFAVSGYSAEDDKIEMDSTEQVEIIQTDDYWFYDNKACSDTAIVFYGGAKVDEMAYTCLVHELASETDVFLLNCKTNLPIIESNLADTVMKEYADQYESVYFVGHSMGGAAAGIYTARHSQYSIQGIAYLGAYGTEQLPENTRKVLYIYGTQDKIVDYDKLNSDIQQNQKNNSKAVDVLELTGGNHAGFGCYGEQKGDGISKISNEEQITETVKSILEWIRKG